MLNEPRQLLFVVLFFVGFFAFTIAETYWLHRKKAVTAARALGFSFASNVFAITVGLFLSSATFVAILAVSRGNSVEVTPDAVAVAMAFVVSFVVPVGVLIVAKWLLLKFLKIASVERPFIYSLLASIGFFLSVFLLPFLVEYWTVR
jgi:hypothetical protein